MTKKPFFSVSLILAVLALLITISSCRSYKNVPYFKDLPDSIYTAPSYVGLSNYSDPIIQTNDLLNIAIMTLDQSEGSALIRSSQSTHAVQSFSNQISGTREVSAYMVDKDGNVELPEVGKIKVAGITTTQAREIIRGKVEKLYRDPAVYVRFANFNISVIGEVAKPAQYTVPSEKVSILDAIAMAGDLTVHGKRENVLLIREVDGAKQFIRFNLNSSDIFQNPFFYLKQGDVIYVEPGKGKAASTDVSQARNLTVLSSFLSLAIIVATRVGT